MSDFHSCGPGSSLSCLFIACLVTPPDPESQNGVNMDSFNNYEEIDLSAQMEMRTPSPANDDEDDGEELMEQVKSEPVEHVEQVIKEEPIAEKISSPSDSPTENQPVKMEEDGELDNKSVDGDDKRGKKKKHSRHSETEDDKSSRKRKHSQSKGDEKSKLERLKEMKFGSSKLRLAILSVASLIHLFSVQDTRRFNFRESEAAKEKVITPKKDSLKDTPIKHAPVKERRHPSPDTFYRAEVITHPVMKTFRDLKSASLMTALDKVFCINPQEISVLTKAEMIEVLDVMHDLNRKREKLTANRVKLTKWVVCVRIDFRVDFSEVRVICNKEIELLSGLEHMMNMDERDFFNQLRQCPPSMDELAPFDPKIGLFIWAMLNVDFSAHRCRIE